MAYIDNKLSVSFKDLCYQYNEFLALYMTNIGMITYSLSVSAEKFGTPVNVIKILEDANKKFTHAKLSFSMLHLDARATYGFRNLEYSRDLQNSRLNLTLFSVKAIGNAFSVLKTLLSFCETVVKSVSDLEKQVTVVLANLEEAITGANAVVAATKALYCPDFNAAIQSAYIFL